MEWNQLAPVLSVLSMCLFVQSQAFTWMSPSSLCESSHAIATEPDPAPPIPTLPQQYSMKVESNILRRKKSVEVEEHYDSINQRASVSITRNGTRLVSIFNFNTSQRYDIYPNGTCETRPSSIDYMGFVSKNSQNRPIMTPVNDVFRFGSKYNMSYVGKEINWSQFGAKFQMDYYFSDPNFTTATGMSEIPVRAVLNGSAGIPGKMYIFENVYEFTSFRAGPIVNEEVFQIPAGIVCTGRSDNKPLPPVPDQLEMSMEIMIPGSNWHPREEYLIYDYAHKLVETTMTLVMAEGLIPVKFRQEEVKADNDILMAISASVVKDYNNGIVYLTEQINMTCAVRKMSPSTSATTMAHGESLLAVAGGNSQFMYQGQTTVRRMLVDVWAMEYNGLSIEVYFLPMLGFHPFQSLIGMFMKNRSAAAELDMPKIFKEVFQSEINLDDEDSQNSTSSSTKPDFTKITADQLAWGLQLEKVLDRHLSQKIVNILHYSPLHLDTNNFQVSHCFKEQQTRPVLLVIKANYCQDVLHNYVGFSNSLRSALAQRMSVSLLHISNLALAPDYFNDTKEHATRVTLTLLGAAPVDGVKQKPISQVKEDLERAISNGITFRVQYTTYSKEFMVHKSMYLLDYRNKTLANTELALMDKVTEPQGSHGQYSSGTVAGIAFGTLVLGAVLTTGVLYLLYKWKRPGMPLTPYKQQSDC
ncbi:unnamed protein product [Candidula unifasciata]|uniref:LolA-like domain-containing protein n=1 Tax=Candidula unifasciata TaxID=100452 RepID=A0A8S3ZN52_9EUPU|nr:unnamed protein product [Candidula unifasciata]